MHTTLFLLRTAVRVMACEMSKASKKTKEKGSAFHHAVRLKIKTTDLAGEKTISVFFSAADTLLARFSLFLAYKNDARINSEPV